MRAWDEHLAHPSLPRTLARRLRAAGFTDVAMEAHAFASCEFDPETYVVSVLPGIRSFVPGHAGITNEEAKAYSPSSASLASATSSSCRARSSASPPPRQGPESPVHAQTLEALPALGVVDHFDQFSAAPDTAFLGPGRRALLGVRARPVGVSKRQRGLEWAA
jgi:hypothetical protein